MKAISFFLVFFIYVVQPAKTQTIDSVMVTSGTRGDTTYRITYNRLTKNKFFGNSWYTALSYTWSRSNEFTLNIGRTLGKAYCGGAGCFAQMKSWGFGFAQADISRSRRSIASAFAEYALFYYPPVAVRMDYLYDLTTGKHYLRPALGISLFALDIMYSYSFLFSAKPNDFKHGLVIRLKFYPGSKKWQRTYPSHC